MDITHDEDLITNEGKIPKGSSFRNGSNLTEKQKKFGSLKGRKGHYSEKLRCWFYLKPTDNFEEVEMKYLNFKINI